MPHGHWHPPHPPRRRWCEAAVHEQGGLAAGARLSGPAVIEQPYTTMIIPPGWQVTVLPSGDLLAGREAA